jgi:hypothetical protein
LAPGSSEAAPRAGAPIGKKESANRRYLAAIKALSQVRKVQANAPAVQLNMQINLCE